jgi:predicted DCC family thiol-disulfide oxidoreductase YuxK
LTSYLIFDGDCGFCTTVARKFSAKTKSKVEPVAWQLTDLSRFGLTPEECSQRVYLVKDGRVFFASRAIAELLKIQKNFAWMAVGWLMRVPPISWLAIPGYSLMARYRHKLPGGTPACQLPKGD